MKKTLSKKGFTRPIKLGLTLGSIVLLTACIEKEKIATIPDAENIFFTSTGQLLVTGGKSIYQIKKTIDSNGETKYKPIDLFPSESCGFAGIAQHDEWIFTTCQQTKLEWKGWTFKLWQDSHLLAANINDENLSFRIINNNLTNDPLDTLTLPNGLAFAPNGKLIVADSNFFGNSGVARVTLDYSEAYPKIQSLEKNWLGLEYGLQTPNGVRVKDDQLYVSDNSIVRRFTFDQNGEIPLLFQDNSGNEVSNLPDDTEFYQGNFIVDDIMPYCGGIAVTHFVEGQLVYQAANGDKYSTLPLSFEFPSSLAFGEGSDYSGNELFVTEKGVLRELNTAYGNQLTKINMDFDLGNPNTCHALNELN